MKLSNKHPSRSLTTEQRLLTFRKIDEITGCWLWTGAQSSGYGIISIKNKSYRVHKIAYEQFIGPVTKLVLHKINCPNKHCFNPLHLYEGDLVDNAQDTIKAGRNFNVSMIKCKYGHDFIFKYGRRICLICRKRINDSRKSRKKKQ